MVKELREKTGAGMLDCKKALESTDGDIENAVDFLRKKGLAAAEKKAGRVAAEGIVLAKVSDDGRQAVLIEVNSETDFVARNDKFVDFVEQVADLIAAERPESVEALLALGMPGTDGLNVAQALSQLIATIGENMSIRRFTLIETEGDGYVGAYVHNGRHGVLVELNGMANGGNEAVGQAARDVAMQVVAARPKYATRKDVPSEDLERERAVLSERAATSGKPEAIIAKIVEGQLNKFYQDFCLLDQAFIKDSDKSVAQMLQAVEKGLGLAQFVSYELGEGIEKQETNFAEEVMSQVKKG